MEPSSVKTHETEHNVKPLFGTSEFHSIIGAAGLNSNLEPEILHLIQQDAKQQAAQHESFVGMVPKHTGLEDVVVITEEEGEPLLAAESQATCAVCLKGDSLKEDLIIFCDGCELAVHQVCYGVSTIPLGDWYCQPCRQGMTPDGVKCCGCLQAGGALKPVLEPEHNQVSQTKAGAANALLGAGLWAHVLCATWDPHMVIQNLESMGPIQLTSEFLETGRRKVECCLCGQRGGSCIGCLWEGCGRPMHPLCTQRSGYLSTELELGQLKHEAYCDKHRKARVSGEAILEILELQLHHHLVKDMSEWNSLRAYRMLQDVKQRYSYGGYRSPEQFFREVAGVFEHLRGGLLLSKAFEKWFEMLLVRLSPPEARQRLTASMSLQMSSQCTEQDGEPSMAPSPPKPLPALANGGSLKEKEGKIWMWDGENQKRVKGPYSSQLPDYLENHPTHEVYTHQNSKSYRVAIWDRITKSKKEERVRRDQLTDYLEKNDSCEIYCNQDGLARVTVMNLESGKKLWGSPAPKHKTLIEYLKKNPGFQVFTGQKPLKSGEISEGAACFSHKTGESLKRKLDSGREAKEKSMKKAKATPMSAVKKLKMSKAVMMQDLSTAKCDACSGLDSLADNQILLCDGCDVPIHQCCYGIKSIPKGDWLCHRCQSGKGSKEIKCSLCLQIGGAMKPINGHKDQWAHVMCVMWDPDLCIRDPELMEPFEYLHAPRAARKKLVCSICKVPGGLCMQCSFPSCCTPFHPRCARSSGHISMEVEFGSLSEMAFCAAHANIRANSNDILESIKNVIESKPAVEDYIKTGFKNLKDSVRRRKTKNFTTFRASVFNIVDNLVKCRVLTVTSKNNICRALKMLETSLKEVDIAASVDI